jgi:hypothetical protein
VVNPTCTYPPLLTPHARAHTHTHRLTIAPVKSDSGTTQNVWSYYFDRNRVHEIEARAQKRLRSQQEKEARLKVSISAVDVTSSVIATQDKHKKRALLEMQANLQTGARIQKRWRNLLADVCQPSAVWDTGQPNSAWVLDQSEGPLRMRKRLVLTPMDCDMSNVSRSPMKAVAKPKTPPPPTTDSLSPTASVGGDAEGAAVAGAAESRRLENGGASPDAVPHNASTVGDGVSTEAKAENDRIRFQAW